MMTTKRSVARRGNVFLALALSSSLTLLAPPGTGRASSMIPKFWQTPYVQYCVDEGHTDGRGTASPEQILVKALQEISGERDCEKSYQRLQKAAAFVLIDRKITDLTPLAEFVLLEQLYLSNNGIEDLAPISGLKRLQVLFLSGNKIRDVSSLASLMRLKKLYLSDNRITDISFLGGLTGLEVLVINRNPIIPDSSHCPTNSASPAVNAVCLAMKRDQLARR